MSRNRPHSSSFSFSFPRLSLLSTTTSLDLNSTNNPCSTSPSFTTSTSKPLRVSSLSPSAAHPGSSSAAPWPSSSSSSPLLKKTSSQPNLRSPALATPPPISSSSSSSSSLPHLSQAPLPHHDLPPLTVTSIPTRHSPLHPQHHHHHQPPLNPPSAFGTVPPQLHQHWPFIGRHAAHHRASVSTCAMTDDSTWDEADNDIEDAQGGIDGFSIKTNCDRQDEEDTMDCQPIDNESSLTHKPSGKQPDKSESCGSSAVGDGSNSGGGPMTIDSDCSAPSRSGAFGARMVRKRPVNRANLLPRPKAHLRVAAQLCNEDVSPDLQTEAEVHRRFRSVPLLPPASSLLSAGSPGSSSFPITLPPKTPSSPFDGKRPQGPLPPPNRFPEQVGPDESLGTGDPSIDSSDDSAPEGETFAGLFNHDHSPGAEDGDRMTREIQKWNKFRGARSGTGPRGGTHAPSSAAFSPGSPDPSPARLNNFLVGHNGGSGSGGGSPCASLARPAKRRFQDPDRFDRSPNSSSFKRRAISPSASIAGSSSCLGSPVLHYLQPSPSTMNQESSKDS